MPVHFTHQGLAPRMPLACMHAACLPVSATEGMRMGEMSTYLVLNPSPCPPTRIRRPLSKTVRFNVLRVIPAGSGAKKGFGSF